MTAVIDTATELDPRHPAVRLTALFDADSLQWLHAPDRSGMASALGRVDGTPTVAFCSDPTVMGGAMGVDGCRVVVADPAGHVHQVILILINFAQVFRGKR